MSLLMRAIKMRLLINQLTNTEFNKFTSTLVKLYGREILCVSLFNHFIHTKISNDNNIKQIDEILDIISNIIKRRRKNRKHLKTNKMDEIPSELLSNISSFLAQHDYASFINTNRSLYVACNDPNSLQYIDLLNVSNYSSINLEHYPSISRLDINLTQFHQFNFTKQQLIANKLQYLLLDGQRQIDIDIENFLNKNFIDFADLEILHCTQFSRRFSEQQIYRVLSKFGMVKSLIFKHVNIKRVIDSEKMKKLFPKLTHLDITDAATQFSKTLLTAFGPQLKTLVLYPFDDLGDLSNICFDKLENLSLYLPSIDVMNAFLNTAENLKNALINIKYHEIDDEPNTEIINQIKHFVKDLICNKSSLEYIEFEMKETEISLITDNVESALYKTKHMKREKMIIFLDIDFDTDYDLEDIMMRLCRITNVLTTSNINNFTLLALFNNVTEEAEVILDTLHEYISSTESIKVTMNEYQIEICNKGFDDGWRQWRIT